MARRKAPLDDVAKACCDNGLPNDKVLVVPGDISVDEDAAAVVEKTVRHFGKLDILVNNAALRVEGYTDTVTLEQFDRAWNVNLRGTLCMIRNAIPHLRQSKGTIINISSAASSTVVRYLTPYSVTKAALDHLTRCTAFENAPYGVRVNAINPGVIKTTFGMRPGDNAQERMEKLEKMTSSAHALGRIGTAQEVARCIAFLASEDASFVTGITMLVDGGLTLLSSLTGANPWHKE
nr:2-(R)-hydroxypropyl-CoM dehydrogenase-like isoform X3 [Dermacentor andersoni]